VKEPRKGWVLVADDQPELRQFLARKLQRWGKKVGSFAIGWALFASLGKEGGEVELVVLDMDFGVGEPDGIKLSRQLKGRSLGCR